MGKLMERERMTWENILKQDTIEEYIRNKGYERVSDRYNGGEVTFENEGGQKIIIQLRYPTRGGNFILFNVSHRKKELIVLESGEDLQDAYDDSMSVLRAEPEVIQEMVEDFLRPETRTISDSYNYSNTRMKKIRLPPREPRE